MAGLDDPFPGLYNKYVKQVSAGFGLEVQPGHRVRTASIHVTSSMWPDWASRSVMFSG
jgi:hypothetical protein